MIKLINQQIWSYFMILLTRNLFLLKHILSNVQEQDTISDLDKSEKGKKFMRGNLSKER